MLLKCMAHQKRTLDQVGATVHHHLEHLANKIRGSLSISIVAECVRKTHVDALKILTDDVKQNLEVLCAGVAATLTLSIQDPPIRPLSTLVHNPSCARPLACEGEDIYLVPRPSFVPAPGRSACWLTSARAMHLWGQAYGARGWSAHQAFDKETEQLGSHAGPQYTSCTHAPSHKLFTRKLVLSRRVRIHRSTTLSSISSVGLRPLIFSPDRKYLWVHICTRNCRCVDLASRSRPWIAFLWS